MQAPESTFQEARRGLAATLALVLAIKLAGLAVDGTLRVFLGDSGSYLHAATSDWIPPDRSVLYAWLVGATAVQAKSATALIALQSLFGAITAALLYGWLAFGLRVPVRWAMAAAVLLAIEPAQWFYERMLMAEATGLLALIAFFAALSRYLVTGHWRWIALYAVLGVLAVSMRLAYLPVILALSILGPVLRTLFEREADRGRPLVAALRLGAHLAVAIALTGWAHGAYQRWYGDLAQTRPGYTANTGMFRLGLVAPLVEPEHFRNTGISPEVLKAVTIPLHDPRTREPQMWSQGGLWAELRAAAADDRQAENAARKISIRAAREHPLRLVAMGFSTVADYFDPAVALPRLHDDLGTRPVDRLREPMLEHLRYDVSGIDRPDTPAPRWFAAGAPWLTFCLLALAPLALLAFWLHRRAPAPALRALLLLASLGLVANQVLFSHIVSYRYLHPLPWFVLANAVLLLQAWRLRNTQSRELA